MASHPKLSQLPWMLAAASAFSFSALLVFANPEDGIGHWGLAAFVLSVMLCVGLMLSQGRAGHMARYRQRRGSLSGPKPGARLPG